MPAHTRLLWSISQPTVRVVGKTIFSLRVEQEAGLPPPPFVVAANHYSHVDPPVIGAALNVPIRFLALEDLFGANRVLDWLITGYEAIPTPRERRPVTAVRTAITALETGHVVGVFPESTRVSHWGTVQAKRGAAWLAKQVGVPLVPVAVVGTGKVLGLENRLQRSRIKVVIGKSIPPIGDPAKITQIWADWIAAQISSHPDSEVDGPRRAFHNGL